nr:translocon-associated protein subunit alpha-like [Ipomoea batatas]
MFPHDGFTIHSRNLSFKRDANPKSLQQNRRPRVLPQPPHQKPPSRVGISRVVSIGDRNCRVGIGRRRADAQKRLKTVKYRGGYKVPFSSNSFVDQEAEAEVVEGTEEGGDLGIVGEDAQDFGEESLSPAPGVDTVCVFPKNPSKSVPAGEKSELIVGMKNDGESTLNVLFIKATLHLPFDHRYLVQNLTTQGFSNSTIPPSAQATLGFHIYLVSANSCSLEHLILLEALFMK